MRRNESGAKPGEHDDSVWPDVVAIMEDTAAASRLADENSTRGCIVSLVLRVRLKSNWTLTSILILVSCLLMGFRERRKSGFDKQRNGFEVRTLLIDMIRLPRDPVRCRPVPSQVCPCGSSRGLAL